jgi:hypothetical protein
MPYQRLTPALASISQTMSATFCAMRGSLLRKPLTILIRRLFFGERCFHWGLQC